MMAKIFINSIILCTLILGIKCTKPHMCLRKNPCLCEFSEYSKIDISDLINGKTDFLSANKDNITYYFHGCVDGVFDVNSVPHDNSAPAKWNASLVRYDSETKNVILLGNSSQINFDIAPDKPSDYQIVYRSDDKHDNVTASIRLICTDYNATLLNIINTADHTLTVASPNVCIKTHHPGLSNGSILLILFLVAVLIYLVGGGLVLYFFRGARGIELIPNIDFWRELPGLVKDGLIFLFSGCNTSFVSSTAETYDRI